METKTLAETPGVDSPCTALSGSGQVRSGLGDVFVAVDGISEC
jgi:hypothetical protein